MDASFKLLKENVKDSYIRKQKEESEIPLAQTEERGLFKFDSQRASKSEGNSE